jgi:hypothetical protein
MIKFSQFIFEKDTSAGEDAWHGSPHSFSGFSRKNTAHTGEGGAAYGSGIYVSSSRAVGEHYRDFNKESKTRRLYKLKIHSDPKKMMHWHKKVSEQSPHVQKALKKVAPDYDWHKNPDPDARHIFHHLRKSVMDGGGSRTESSESASHTLQRAGIHGVEYHGDIEGKAATRPTNKVIFDPKHISIAAKYDHKDQEVKD